LIFKSVKDKDVPESLMHRNIWSTTIDTRERPAASVDCYHD
jgi:hypothetical protein